MGPVSWFVKYQMFRLKLKYKTIKLQLIRTKLKKKDLNIWLNRTLQASVMLGTKIRAEEALTRSNNLYWVTLSIFWHPSNPNSYSQIKRSSVRSMLNSLV